MQEYLRVALGLIASDILAVENTCGKHMEHTLQGGL
jgi:hypothetical protein